MHSIEAFTNNKLGRKGKHVLRISLQTEKEDTRFKLEGKLTQQWVAEAANQWAELVANSSPHQVIVDLCGVMFVDQAGEALLVQMVARGARIETCGPMMNILLEEINKRAQEAAELTERGPGALALFLFLFLAMLAIGIRRPDPTHDVMRLLQANAQQTAPPVRDEP